MVEEHYDRFDCDMETLSFSGREVLLIVRSVLRNELDVDPFVHKEFWNSTPLVEELERKWNMPNELSGITPLFQNELEDLSEEEIERYIDVGRRVLEGSRNSGGRPSKVDRWEQEIREGNSNLEDAKNELSYKTYQKLRDRVGS